MDPASISTLEAIFGSLTGALSSSVSTWITQRHQDRRDLLAKRIFHREQLYSDFINESARSMAEAIQHNFQDPSKLIPTYALLSRIRLSSSLELVGSAELIIQHIMSTHSVGFLIGVLVRRAIGSLDTFDLFDTGGLPHGSEKLC